MSEYEVASVDDVDDGERVTIQLEGREISVFNLDGEYKAYNNWCAHQAGPACEGNVTGTTEVEYDRETTELELNYCREGEILNCPWHGWEYDLTSGECLSRQGVKLPEYPTEVRDGTIYVTL
ncbi:Rieske (2Fe-2S) protein [Natrialbaceae archaeon AArc-T1-2]|uniref:Rieske (2Fe-2S) protein n=1 Tax=Natrialbaceae archaeon AArc-T1-2 TaxID=3053904 RepID=UPI00255AB9D2|nr:Rieske (2Fe-2S) protein [Natrialbaceae archaeon AArc-T1-2]WIV65900.1 Rieske (2Fe-2S) protein [Natrialbaceae archaeon AArc-T1-2]